MVKSISPKWSNSFGSIETRLVDQTENLLIFRTILDAPREEQIVGFYESLRRSKTFLTRDQLIQWLTLFSEDFQIMNDDQLGQQIDQCYRHYKKKSSDGVDLGEIVEFFVDDKNPLKQRIRKAVVKRR